VQQQAALSATNPATHLKVQPSVAPSVQVLVPSTATPKTKTNTKHSTVSKPSFKNRKAQTLRFISFLHSERNALPFRNIPL
jgi:hypothetical protein